MALCRVCKDKGIKKEADVFLKEDKLYLCEQHFNERFEKNVLSTIKKYRMAKKDDKILVALSGGKDSMALWYVLNKLGYNAKGFHIDLGIGEYSKKSKEVVLTLANILKQEVIIIDIKKELGATIPKIANKITRKTCAICGTIKRYYFNYVAHKNRFNIIATGHNFDDEVSTLFGNILQWNFKYLSKKYPVLWEDEFFPRKIKPFALTTEEEIINYVKFNKIPYITCRCPMSENTPTNYIYKEILLELSGKFRGLRKKFYKTYLKDVFPLFNQQKEKYLNKKLTHCKICGEPSLHEICSVCQIKQKLKEN